MPQPQADPASEVKRLQRCVNDLVSVLALPAAWNGSEPNRILELFLDALLTMLDLDFLYARVQPGSHDSPIESLKTSQLSGTSLSRQEIRQALDRLFSEDPQLWTEDGKRHLAGQELSVLPIKMGIEGALGVIVAGSQRADFPEQRHGHRALVEPIHRRGSSWLSVGDHKRRPWFDFRFFYSVRFRNAN